VQGCGPNGDGSLDAVVNAVVGLPSPAGANHLVRSKGLASRSVYSATKAALRSFARTLTTDLKSRKIRVDMVSPGAIDTPGLRGLGDGLTELYRDRVPLGRVGRPVGT
jgi:NAD(P)-dependent dehydrogenase (short-subunit alcohol dehydrogenase family)